MARTPAYLQLSKSNVFYFRLRVPKSLRSILGKREIHRSLKTRCRREAMVRGGQLLASAERLFSQAVTGANVCWQSLSWDKQVVSNSVVIAQPVEPSVALSSGPKLSEITDQYLKTQRLEGVSEKTVADKRSVVELLVRIIGDKPVDQISRKAAQRFRETALKLPPRMNQLSPKPLEKLIEEAETTISITTFNNYVKNLTTVFSYAVQEGHIDHNPFDGLRVKQRVKASEQRSRFTEEDLKRLFSSEVYARRDGDKPYQYWLPLMGLYTGARLNELCQLYLDDIIHVDDIDCIHIQASRPDQKLKNPTSERLIPIHSKLKALGFMEYVEQQRQLGHERLFDLVRHSRHGYAATPSKWFARYRDKLGFKGGDEKKDFHSFRHTVADHLKQQGVAESLIGGILGHQTGGITFSRYGKDFKPVVLVPVIEQIDLIPLTCR
ncbi:tyrosine-type recombinase/integrase [Pontibacterium sp. N1Y112]|uniref:Tyrosine-type recombinase/integrase n=1 Tax=Pontibacterium sinense TaxID=2781979 RepID=A0A8J7FCD2_9GAMM|nr:DUF6538 domain-containing protein [Pontibacterium sinense]MBE9397101.1 tyrosine-type recombinase/integrase [Pontibacterium sinense]